jgi:amino acid transporter
MPLQNPHLALGSCQRQVTLWIAAIAMVLSSVGCARRSKTPLTVVEVAKPVRDVPVYSEWIGATVGYIPPKSRLATILGLIPMAPAPEPDSEQHALLAYAILGGLTVSSIVTVFLVSAAHLLIHRKDVHDDEIEPRSGEVIYA